MIVHIACRELLGHLRSARFLVLSALSLVLLGTGAFVSARRYAARSAYADALEAMRQTAVALERPGDDPSTRFGWRSGQPSADAALRAVRPPLPSSVLALGSELTVPGFWQFGTEGATPGPAADAAEGSSGDAPLDVEFIVRAILSLLALLLAADAIASERESGILRALFAAPISRIDVLLGKYSAGMLTLCVPLTTGAALSFGVLAAGGVPVARGDVLTRTALLFTGAMVYLGVVFALGVLVSACCREARTAVVVLMGAWVTIVLVLPVTTSSLARVLRPVTPYELFRQERVTGLRQLESERARVLATVWRTVTGSDVVPIDGVLAPEVRRRYDDARSHPDAVLMQRKRALLRTLDDTRAREVDAQARLGAQLGLLSPAATFSAFAAEVVGTGASFRRHWDQASADHQQRLERATFDRRFGTEIFDARASYLRITFQPNPADPRDRVPSYAELPAFAPPAEDIDADLRAALPLLALLVLDGVALFAGAAIAIVRMEV